MAYEGILFEHGDGVATVTLDRPAKLNALTNVMLEGIVDAAAQAASDEATRVLLIRGAGRSFCAGDDLRDMGDLPRPVPPGSDPVAEYQHAVVKALRSLPKPVVASIHGFCLGMGHDLAMSCDLRVAAQSAHLGEPRMLRGMNVTTGGTYLLPRLVGLSRAMEMLLLSRFVDADEALRIGLVHRVVPDAELEAATRELVGGLALGPTRAYGLVKLQVYGQYDMQLDPALRDMIRSGRESIEDEQEGVDAFFEHREPRFKGR
jgi:2-(1,2-epoxy-1,2-dihydrophenyl)acetyl-CoA isomerase